MVEILLVLAIISILGTIVFLGIGGQRKRARVVAAVASVKSAMTLAMACDSVGGEVLSPEAGSIGGGPLCAGSEGVPEIVVWPALTNECYYCGMSEGNVLFRCSGLCGSGNESFCDYKTSRCEGRQ